MNCVFCDNDHCESVPYPKGKRFICQKCGEEYYDFDAAVYREAQRKQLHKLMETINKTETEQ